MTPEFDYAIVDVETNILNNLVGSMKASPFFEDNKIVLGGVKLEDAFFGVEGYFFFSSTATDMSALFKRKMLVGHNIKFDLLYLRKCFPKEYSKWVKEGGVVWDTQIVEYLLSGQSTTYPKLDDLSKKYGGTVKDERIKEYWEAGIDTADIPRSELTEYLREDLKNTEIVFNNQVAQVDKLDIYALVHTQMEALLALVEMEWNGMYLDVVDLVTEETLLAIEIDSLMTRVGGMMRAELPSNIKAKVNPQSAVQLSQVLFGGEVKVINYKPIIDASGLYSRYKSGLHKGEIREKKVEEVVSITGFGLVPIEEEKNKLGVYSTDDSTLEKLIVKFAHAPLLSREAQACTLMREIRTLRTKQKDLSTYYQGYRSLVWPGGLLHPNYNQCATATGRLSCSSPNVQNVNAREEEA